MFFLDLLRTRRLEKENSIALIKVLERAEKIVHSVAADKQRVALHDYIRVLLIPLIWKNIRQEYLNDDHNHSEIKLSEMFPFEVLGYRDDSLTDTNYELHLGVDLLVPNPWRPKALNQLGFIGHEDNPFEQNVINHDVTLFLPMRISYVWRGHHSIMNGMLNHSGTVMPKNVVDCSIHFERYSFDGTNWIDSQTKRMWPTPYPEFGWVWELSKRYKDVLC